MAQGVDQRLVEWLEERLAASDPVPEALQQAPQLDTVGAYRVQQALIERRIAKGDRLIGYKAALTSKAMQLREGIGEPVMGTLLASRLKDEAEPVSLRGFLQAAAEPEVGVVIGRDLAGPGVTPHAAWAAVAGLCAAVELGDMRSVGRRSLQHNIVCNTFNGGHIFSGRISPPTGVDLRREGMVLSKNGQHQASATAAEVLGNPIHSVVFLANKLGELGLGLKAGMVLLTGSIVPSIAVSPGDSIRVEFSHLGELSLSFVA